MRLGLLLALVALVISPATAQAHHLDSQQTSQITALQNRVTTLESTVQELDARLDRLEAPTPTPTPTATPSPTPTATPSPTPTATPSPSLTLTQPDGGAGYFGQFTNPLAPNTFPVAVWFEVVEAQSQVDQDKAAGINTYMGLSCPECTNEALLRSNGMRSFIQINERTRFNDLGSEQAGWLLADEVDMQVSPSEGYAQMQQYADSTPNDGKARYTGYGKGVLWWQTDSEAAPFINRYQDLQGADAYWFTDPNERSNPKYGKASSYGWNIDRLRELDAADGQRKPQIGIVEVGWPFTESAADGGRAITGPEFRAAAWHSIIAGARGLILFNHNFGGPCQSQHVLRDSCGTQIRPAVSAVNAQIKSLAAVLNSPTVTGGMTTSTAIRSMVKWDGSNFYVFAGSRENVASLGSITIPCIGNATATRLGEAGTVDVIDGKLIDNFGDGNAVHVYRIDGGSSCGL